MNTITPSNVEFEQSILCGCMISADDLAEYAHRLRPEDFYRQAHQIIFRAILNLSGSNKPVAGDTVADELNRSDELGKAGGGAYLSQLLDLPPAVDPQFYADSIRGLFLKRKLIEAGNVITKLGHRKDVDGREALAKAQETILSLQLGRGGSGAASFADLALDSNDRYEALQKNSTGITGIPSGFIDLDAVTCGFQKSDLVILAARPAMGKTALALNSAVNAAAAGHAVGFFSLEMSKEQLFDRSVSGKANVNSTKFRSGRFERDDWERITYAQSKLYDLQLYVDDTPALHYAELSRRARRLKAQHDIGIAYIDYLQLMTGDKQSGRVEEVGSISRNLKGLAKLLNIPVVCLSQLSRGVESRDNKRPRLSDLRDSGAIEQDADLVIFLYRDVYYNPATDYPDITEVSVGKHRNGPVGTVNLRWSGSTTKFSDLTEF